MAHSATTTSARRRSDGARARPGGRAATRREREHERTRDDILLAAATALARHGFDATTMQAIAKEAGYTAPSLYSYFKSKEEIVLGLFERVRGEILAAYDAPMPTGLTFDQKLELLVGRMLEVVDRRRDAFAVFLAMRPPCGVPASKGAGAASSGFDVHARRLAAWLASNAERGELSGLDVEDAAYALLGVQFAFFRRWLAGNEAGPLARRAPLLVDLFLNGIRGGATRRDARKR